MQRETTTTEVDYWYRLILVSASRKYFSYSWGDLDREHNYRADLHYLGRGSYTLSNRTYNDFPLPYDKGDSVVIKRRHRKRVWGYEITMRLIEKLL